MILLVTLQDGSDDCEVQLYLAQADGVPDDIAELEADIRDATGNDQLRVLDFSAMLAECQAGAALERLIQGEIATPEGQEAEPCVADCIQDLLQEAFRIGCEHAREVLGASTVISPSSEILQ